MKYSSPKIFFIKYSFYEIFLTAGRQPKLLVAGQPEGEIIIDLTQDLDLGLDSLGLSNEVEEVEEVLVTGDQSEKEPQIISFKTNQTPSLFAAPQKTNEVISFVPVEPQPDQTVPVLEESSSPASPVSVTPLLQVRTIFHISDCNEMSGS